MRGMWRLAASPQHGVAVTPVLRRTLLMAPLGIAAVGGSALWVLLERLRDGTYDPHGVPSPLIGKPVPNFRLPGLGSSPGFTSADLVARRGTTLLNFFASWCLPCAQEASVLMKLKQRGITLWGIAYKDKPTLAEQFLRQDGDPYQRVAVDEPGRVAIDFGLYGVPETFVVDHNGIIRWRWAGGLSPDIVRELLDPLLKAVA